MGHMAEAAEAAVDLTGDDELDLKMASFAAELKAVRTVTDAKLRQAAEFVLTKDVLQVEHELGTVESQMQVLASRVSTTAPWLSFCSFHTPEDSCRT